MIINRNPEYFLTIVQEKNISRAAEKLYISQSSLSQHLARLEVALGATLLNRTKSPIELTEAGRIYQSYLESNHYLYQKMETELSYSKIQTVKVGTGTWRGSLLLPEILPAFLIEHPGVRVSLHEFPVSELTTLLKNETVDFVVMNTAGTPGDGMIQEIIAHERILLVMNCTDSVAQEFLQQSERGEIPDLKKLQNHRLIALNRKLTVGKHISNFLERNMLTFPDRIHTTNNSTALNLTAKGLGFCFLVETGLGDAYSRPELLVFDLQSEDLRIPLSLLYKKNSYISPLVRDAMDSVSRHYQNMIRANDKKHIFCSNRQPVSPPSKYLE